MFDRFELHPTKRLLLVDGSPVGLGARAFDVLLALAERSDRVVSKAELLELAWQGLVVEENNLTVQISALRRALGHEAIVTANGRGYRLASPVRKAAVSPPAPRPLTRLERRLVVIVQAELVAWARLVAADAAWAAAAWKQVRVDLIEQTVAGFGGRLFELTAERTQIEFASAVDAVDWALQLQAQLARQAELQATSGEPVIRMRIGISVDDVIVDDGKLVGEGLNVAADLQQSASAGEVLTTQKVADFVGRKLNVDFEPLGSRQMPRLRQLMNILRVRPQRPPATGPVLGAPVARVASLAVLPFADPGAGADTYFGEAVTEEIIATLSLNRSLFVIAHSSTLRFRRPGDDLAAVADDLGVRYLVTGTVRRAQSQLRIHVSLVHGPDQRILWQQPFDGQADDLFAVQAEIAAKVAAAIAPRVEDEEVARVRKRPTDSHDAYDCVLRALPAIYALGTPAFDEAGDFLKRAIVLDPGYAQAHAHLAWWYSFHHGEGRQSTVDSADSLAIDHALHAIRLDPRDAWALSVAGYMLTFVRKQHAQALEVFDTALQINPGCAAVWARSAATLSCLGRADEALARLQRAMQLSPFDQHMFWHLTVCGGSCFVAGRYEDAVGWLGKALRLNPRFNGARRVQVAALVRTGALDEARDLAREMLADSPGFSVAEFGRRSAMLPRYAADIMLGLREAGLPD